MRKDHRTEYKIEQWADLAALERLLNRMVAEDWRVDSHRLSSSDNAGWTIFSRTVHLDLPLLERYITAGDAYRALNHIPITETEIYGKQLFEWHREADAIIKKAAGFEESSR